MAKARFRPPPGANLKNENFYVFSLHHRQVDPLSHLGEKVHQNQVPEETKEETPEEVTEASQEKQEPSQEEALQQALREQEDKYLRLLAE